MLFTSILKFLRQTNDYSYVLGRNQTFSAKGLAIVYDYFKKKGYEDSEIVIIVKHIPQLLEEDIQIINSLDQMGVLHNCPSRFAGRELIKSDDDLFILSTAKEIGGIVLSRDQFRDNYDKMTTYRDVIKYRLLQPTFIGDILKLPDDPMGKNGPNLDNFLRFSD